MYSDDVFKRELDKKALNEYNNDRKYDYILALIEYLKKLNPELAEIYWRKHWKSEPYRIIAKVMGLTVSQVRYKLTRAQKILDTKRSKK